MTDVCQSSIGVPAIRIHVVSLKECGGHREEADICEC